MTAIAIDALESATMADTQEGEYTIDELAATARVPSRTIRFYQAKGALPPPVIRGRVAYYGDKHLERLRLIAQLQDRGLRMDAIRDLVTSIDKGDVDLAEWLGVEQKMQAPWVQDQPRTVTEEELYALAGSRRPGLLADLQRAKLVRRNGDVYLVHSPALLALGMKLESEGIDLDTALVASEILRKHTSRAVSELVELFFRRAGEGLLGGEPGAFVETLRPAGLEAARVIFGREMARELRQLVESGKMTKLPSKARRAREKGRR